MRINFTTYDVRREQDIIHAGTSHCDVMVLNSNSSQSEHPFLYARVLGIYHANVIYPDADMADYRPHRLEFVWVRWYERDHSLSAGYTSKRLDRVHFPPMIHEDSFGFLDPDDILRACHIIPALSQGRLHTDGRGISHCAQDSQDWRAYHINRWAGYLHPV